MAADLIARGITTPDQLGAYGIHDGGQLAAVMQIFHPNMFGAICGLEPLTDMKNYVRLSGGFLNPNYGDPDVPEEWAYIGPHSPYDGIGSDADYPPALYITSRSDRLFPYPHGRKQAARLAEHGHEVWFYENTECSLARGVGHLEAAFRNALVYSFFQRKLGRGGVSAAMVNGGGWSEPDRRPEETAGFEGVDNVLALRSFLDGLPERERTVLELSFFKKMTQKQIAKKLGISRSTVQLALATASMKLRWEDQLDLPAKPLGRTRVHKIPDEVLAYARQLREKDPPPTFRLVAAAIAERFGITVKPDSVQIALARIRNLEHPTVIDSIVTEPQIHDSVAAGLDSQESLDAALAPADHARVHELADSYRPQLYQYVLGEVDGDREIVELVTREVLARAVESGEEDDFEQRVMDSARTVLGVGESPQDRPDLAASAELTLGQWVRAARTARGLSQSALGEPGGLRQNYIAQIESGDVKNPSRGVFLWICVGLRLWGERRVEAVACFFGESAASAARAAAGLPDPALEQLVREVVAQAGIAADDVAGFVEQTQLVWFGHGAEIEFADSVYLVVRGKVKFGLRSSGDERALVEILGASDVFGELSALVPDSGGLEATYRALG